MREIKFRAWDKKRQKMCSVDDICFTSEKCICWLGDIQENICYEVKSDDAHLMQYTGLHDKQGKEIYEGDIVKFRWNRKHLTSEVAWGTCGFWIVRWRGILKGAEYHQVEVIGNIWENPELVK